MAYESPEQREARERDEANHYAISGNLMDLMATRKQMLRTLEQLRSTGAADHLRGAINDAATALDELHTQLLQKTLYSVPDVEPEAFDRQAALFGD